MNAERSRTDSTRETQAPLHRARAHPTRRVHSAAAHLVDLASRHRRGPLRVAVGTRLSARLSAAGVLAERSPGVAAHRAHRDRRHRHSPGDIHRLCLTSREYSSPASIGPTSATVSPRRTAPPNSSSFHPRGASAATRASFIAWRARSVEETADFLVRQGFEALPYHAGLDSGSQQPAPLYAGRRHRHGGDDRLWHGHRQARRALRWHLDLPKSVEGYYQSGSRRPRWPSRGPVDVVRPRNVVQQRRMIDQSEAMRSTTRCHREAGCSSRPMRNHRVPPCAPARLLRRGRGALRQL